jgi:hypothetical protein
MRGGSARLSEAAPPPSDCGRRRAPPPPYSPRPPRPRLTVSCAALLQRLRRLELLWGYGAQSAQSAGSERDLLSTEVSTLSPHHIGLAKLIMRCDCAQFEWASRFQRRTKASPVSVQRDAFASYAAASARTQSSLQTGAAHRDKGSDCQTPVHVSTCVVAGMRAHRIV